MRIQHNIMAMNSYRNLRGNNTALAKNLEKLSSGYRINRAGDDAAGLAISEKMRAQISGLSQAQKNAQSGINLVQTAEGSLTEVHDMLNRMTTLANQAANGTYEGTDRQKLQAEVDALVQEIDRIADNSNFNGQKLLDGSLGGYNGTNATGAGVFVKDGINVSGGKLAENDSIQLKQSTGGTITVGDVKIGGVAVTANSLAAKGLTVNIVKPKDENGAEVNTGKFTVKITVEDSDRDTAVAALADAVGDGLTMNFDVLKVAGAAKNTTFSTDGTGGGLTLQIGADKAETIKVSVANMGAKSLGVKGLDISNADAANAAIDTIKAAIEKVSVTRGNLGAVQNRLEHTINNLGVMEENIQDAESNIRDTDVAEEMMAYTKNNILIQSAQAMLAQANQVPQGVLQLMQ